MYTTLKHLIIVPGHASFKDSVTEVPAQYQQDEYWALQSFQIGEPPYYVEHIEAGVELLAQDPSALLLFSGGRTRKEAGHWSEAATYNAIADYCDYWQHANTTGTDVGIAERVAQETYARDSLENLQFSLFRFYQLTGGYPEHVTVVGWEFKRERFDLHRATLHIPAAHFAYIGCNNPKDLDGAMAGERKTLDLFQKDPFGKEDPLHAKRLDRNPFNEQPPYQNLPSIIR